MNLISHNYFSRKCQQEKRKTCCSFGWKKKFFFFFFIFFLLVEKTSANKVFFYINPSHVLALLAVFCCCTFFKGFQKKVFCWKKQHFCEVSASSHDLNFLDHSCLFFWGQQRISGVTFARSFENPSWFLWQGQPSCLFLSKLRRCFVDLKNWQGQDSFLGGKKIVVATKKTNAQSTEA